MTKKDGKVLAEIMKQIAELQKDLSALNKIVMFDKSPNKEMRDELKQLVRSLESEVGNLRTRISDNEACERADDGIITNQGQRITRLEEAVKNIKQNQDWVRSGFSVPAYEYNTGLKEGKRQYTAPLEDTQDYKIGFNDGMRKAKEEIKPPPVMSVNEIAKYIQANYNNEQTTNILSFFAQDLRKLPNGDINPNSEYSKGYDAGVEECKKALSHV